MIENTVYQKLSTVLDNVSPLILKENSDYPAITYQNITEIPHNHLKGECSISNARIQVDIWAESYAEVKGLYPTVKSAMTNSLVLGTNEFYEQETKLYRLSIDFSVWE